MDILNLTALHEIALSYACYAEKHSVKVHGQDDSSLMVLIARFLFTAHLKYCNRDFEQQTYYKTFF